MNERYFGPEYAGWALRLVAVPTVVLLVAIIGIIAPIWGSWVAQQFSKVIVVIFLCYLLVVLVAAILWRCYYDITHRKKNNDNI